MFDGFFSQVFNLFLIGVVVLSEWICELVEILIFVVKQYLFDEVKNWRFSFTNLIEKNEAFMILTFMTTFQSRTFTKNFLKNFQKTDMLEKHVPVFY